MAFAKAVDNDRTASNTSAVVALVYVSGCAFPFVAIDSQMEQGDSQIQTAFTLLDVLQHV